MAQSNLIEENIEAITSSLNSQLVSKGITLIKATHRDCCIQIMLEAEQVPNQQNSVELIRSSISNLEANLIKKVKVYGRQTGEDFPDWQEEFEIATQAKIGTEELLNQSIEDKSTSSTVQTEAEYPTTSQAQQLSWFGSLFGVVAGVTEAVGNAAMQANVMITETAVSVGGSITNAALSTTDGVGYLLSLVSDSPQLQELTKTFQVDWLINVIDKVDIVKAETSVRKLQQKYPNEEPSEIAHRLILEKAIFAGGSGLASSLLPGVAAAMFAVDLAATTLLQAEMVYQIACAYGLDLKEPARKGEVLAIFGLSLGGSQVLKSGSEYALKAGLGFLRNIPAAGAVIGTSTNALMLYALGHGACKFYEAKLNPLTITVQLVDAQIEGEKYLKEAISQEVLMDQILVHVIIAGHPDKTWKSILPELQAFNFSPASQEIISKKIISPPSLEALLDQLNQDFAVALLAQCQKTAQLDGVITKEEARIIEKIAKKFEIDLTSRNWS